jgi:hypothetical protein
MRDAELQNSFENTVLETRLRRKCGSWIWTIINTIKTQFYWYKVN